MRASVAAYIYSLFTTSTHYDVSPAVTEARVQQALFAEDYAKAIKLQKALISLAMLASCVLP